MKGFSFLNKININYLLLTYLILLSIYLFKLTSEQAINLVFSDQIDLFYGYFSANVNHWDLFMQQHGPHRQGVGSLLMYPVYKLSGWDISSIAYLSTTILILATIFFYMALSKVVISARVITMLALITLLLSLGSIELLTIVPNIAHSILPLFFLSLIAFAFTQVASDKKLELIVLFLVCLSLFTGFGIFTFLSYIVVVTIKYIGKLNNKEKTFMDKWGLVFIYMTLALMVFIFSIDYSFSRAQGCISTALSNIDSLILYTGAVSSIPFGGRYISVGLFIFIVEVVLAFILFIKVLKGDDRLSFLALFLILITLGFVVNVALGRHCLGLESAYASRYYLLTLPGIIGSIIALSMFTNKWAKYLKIFLAVLILFSQFRYITPNSKNLGRAFYGHKNNFLICLDEGKSVSECNKKFTIHPSSERLESILLMMKE